MTKSLYFKIKNLPVYAYEDYIDTHEEEFIERFCKGEEVMDLTSVSWNSCRMYVRYVLYSGQHIVDSFHIKEWLEFYDR